MERLALEFDRQVATMLRLGYQQIAGMSNEAFAQLFVPLRARVGELPAALVESEIPFVLVLDRDVVPAAKSMLLVEQDGRRGVVDMNPTQPSAFTSIEEVELPDGAA